MLDLGSISFVISPEATIAFFITVVTRAKPKRSKDVSESNLKTEELNAVSFAVSFGNHHSSEEKDHAFEVINTSKDYDAMILTWYVEKHKAAGTMTSHLHFTHCPSECLSYGKIHQEQSITYYKSISLSDKAIHVGARVMSNPTIAQKLPSQYPKCVLLFHLRESEKLPDNQGCDHRIESLGLEDTLRMGPIYQLSHKTRKILGKYLHSMIKERKIGRSSSTVGSPILFVCKRNGRGLRLCIEF